MAKYKIIKNGKDDYTLTYQDKEIKFHSTVGIVNRMQDAIKQARMKMVIDLSKQGMSLKDLEKVEKKDGKTYVDESNRKALERYYIEDANSIVFMDIIKELMGISWEDLVNDIGLITQDEITDFSIQIGNALTGRFPS